MSRSAPQFPRRSRQLAAGGELTAAQFWTLAQLMRSRDPARAAARLVLVDGLAAAAATAAEAAAVVAAAEAEIRWQADELRRVCAEVEARTDGEAR